ncbi:hypothetical protein [Luteibacter sp. 9135]|uniref:hypothetical protein n=1 Tax=Luteibacter sp. 9135 TaxID=1500893 RepID=UPI000568331A|nr:hypothetical protein [Luteibacter sp. 9135]
MSTGTSHAQAQSWAQLALFRIYKNVFPDNEPTLHVFNNGRQQCEVRIVLSALDNNGNSVDLSAADIATIELIDYVTGEPLPRLENHPADLTWAFSSTSAGYVWDEALVAVATAPDSAIVVAAEPHPLPDAQGKTTLTFYVSTTSTKDRQLAARIRLPSEGGSPQYITTNTASAQDPVGEGQGGRFNSSVIVHPTAFPSLPASSYGDITNEGYLTPVRVGSQDYFYWTREHYLHVSYKGTLLHLKSVSGAPEQPPGFAIYASGGVGDAVKWAISYYGQPGAEKPENFPLPPLAQLEVVSRATHPERNTQGEVPENPGAALLYKPLEMFDKCIGNLVGRAVDRVVVGLLMGNVAARFLDKDKKSVAAITRMTLHIMDVHGNDHQLSIAFAGKVNELILTKTGRAPRHAKEDKT